MSKLKFKLTEDQFSSLVYGIHERGTTARAAKDAGYRFIGIEAEAKWCEVAAARCGQETMFAA